MSVIIPTYNEAQAIGRVLADLSSDLVTKVIVVDSASNDGTPEIAARMGACVIQESRRGYGRACLTGLAAANSADVVVFLDGDYSDRPSELPILLSANHRGPCGHHTRFPPWRQHLTRRTALVPVIWQSPVGGFDQAFVWRENH